MSFPRHSLGLNFGMEKAHTSDQRHPLGTVAYTPDGRKFRYAKAGTSALSPALFNTYITTPTHEDTVTIAHAAGTQTVTVTASGVSASDFKDGYLVVSAGTGIGEVYKIKSNTASDSSSKITITFYPGDELVTAWDTSDTDVDVFPNPYNGLVVCPTDAQQHAVGVALTTIDASYYFWAQTQGPCPIKMDNASAAGGLELDEKWVMQSTNHAGQGLITASPSASTIDTGKQICGYVIQEADITNDECTLVNLMLE